MKFERLLLGLFASFLMVGCSQNEDLPNGGEEQTQAKDSYITVKIKSASDAFSRADEDFEDGTTDEGKVSNAIFFFFNSQGQPIDVNNGSNYKAMNLSTTTDKDDNGNTESKSAAVVVLQKPSQTPTQMAVVLNWSYNAKNLVSLDELSQMVVADATDEADDNGFMMSNAVYVDEVEGSEQQNAVIKTVAVTAANFADNETESLKNPVTAYVERLAAKVTVSEDTDENENYDTELKAFKTGVKYKDGNVDVDVYAKIEGWYLNTVNPSSKIVKDIDAEWISSLNWKWNDESNFRSYWATSAIPSEYKYKAFSWTDGIVVNPEATEVSEKFKSWKSLNESLYCFENTSYTKTKVLIKVTLGVKDETAENKWKDFTAYHWHATYYKDIESLRKDVLLNINAQIEMAGGTDTQKLSDADFKLIYASNTTSSTEFYQIKFALADDYESVSLGEGETATSTKEIVEGISPAKKWQNGATYYYTEIIHQYFEDETSLSGVVRNHSYKLAITQVKGLGTPGNVPNPDPEPDPEPIIPDPVYPSETETFISAQINVLSWKLVGNNVVLGQ